jgi:hypothetical protein
VVEAADASASWQELYRDEHAVIYTQHQQIARSP